MNGIIIIDKPAGWTSFDVVAKLRGALKEKHIGHSGTLDPMATGVLPIFVGRATRAIEFCLNSDKEYIAGLKLGLSTDTQDVTGNILSVCETSVTAEELSDILSHFLGAQKQIPPMYSAVKINGNKLYDLARRGIEVPRPERDIYISDIKLLSGEENEFVLKVTCSKGTYIRTLCHDIGRALGCGGTMSSLRRTRAGAYTIGMARPLDEVLELISSGGAADLPTPVDSVFSEYPHIKLNESETHRCRNGAPCRVANTKDGTYRFYGPDDKFLLLGEIKGGSLKVIKGFFSNNDEK